MGQKTSYGDFTVVAVSESRDDAMGATFGFPIVRDEEGTYYPVHSVGSEQVTLGSGHGEDVIEEYHFLWVPERPFLKGYKFAIVYSGLFAAFQRAGYIGCNTWEVVGSQRIAYEELSDLKRWIEESSSVVISWARAKLADLLRSERTSDTARALGEIEGALRQILYLLDEGVEARKAVYILLCLVYTLSPDEKRLAVCHELVCREFTLSADTVVRLTTDLSRELVTS